MSDQILSTTTSLCATCLCSLAAQIWRVDGRVLLRKNCPEHGAQEALIAADADWYTDAVRHQAELQAPRNVTHDVEQGCPFDCGTCAAHEQRMHLPVLPVTSACNLECPICYTHNKSDGAYHMSEQELLAILTHLRRAAPEQRIINMTGGEPTLHPDLVRLVELCHAEGLRRITISTHGLTFLSDESMLARLAELGARVVLSFDSLREEANRALLGGNLLSGKLRVLALLERYGVHTSLLPVLARGHNDAEVGELVRLGLSKDFVRSIELHTVTFTGQGGSRFHREARYSPDQVLLDLEQQTDGMLRRSDFVPAPAAHPLCFQCAYLLCLDDGRWLPFPRFMSRAELRQMLRGGFYLHPSAETERVLQDVITRLWAGDIVCSDADLVLGTLKRLTQEIFAPGMSGDERVLRAEQSVKLVQVHAYMDAETFDTDRVRQCCVCIPEADGSTVPACAYITLYKERDPRFATTPRAHVRELGPGRLPIRLPVVQTRQP